MIADGRRYPAEPAPMGDPLGSSAESLAKLAAGLRQRGQHLDRLADELKRASEQIEGGGIS